MKKLKTLWLALGATLCLSTGALAGEGKKQEVYMFGIAAAFGDSVVYFTDIQTIQGEKLVKKGLLDARNQYSYQLKGYLENVMNLPHRTCAIYFSEKMPKLEKKYLKLCKKYQADPSVVFRILDAGKFRFQRFSTEE